MFCRYCGNELPDDAKFCNKCGNSVAEAKPIVHEAEPPKSEITKQEAPKIVEMPKEPTPKIDWATASRLDKELNKPHNPASVLKIVGILCGCFCGVILLFNIFSTIANNSKIENKKPANTSNTKVEETVQATPMPEPEPEPENTSVADPREPSTWIYCTGEEEWYEDAIFYGEDFNYDEWLYYAARLENNYDESGYLIYPDDNWPDEEYNEGNSIVYIDQYAHNEINVNHKNPVGYFERYTEDGYSGGLEIVGSKEDDCMTFNFYLDPGQTGYYGYSWVEPDFTITTAWLNRFSTHVYAIKLDENTYVRIGMYGTMSTVKADDYCGVYDIVLEDAVTNYETTVMSDREISGTYYCVYQEEYIGG